MAKNKINYIILFLLLIFGIILSLYYFNKLDPSPSILIQEHDAQNIEGLDLYRDNIATFEISSRYDNLGIIAIRFQTFKRINDDTLIFRIKEKDSQNWIYTAKYKTDQFRDHGLFPFGFPLIENSKNKTYQVELNSTGGDLNNHVRIDIQNPNIISKYQYPIRSYSLRSPLLHKYVAIKIINILSNFDLLIPVFLYFLPFLYFIIQNVLNNHYKKQIYSSILLFIFILLSANLLRLPEIPAWNLSIFLIWVLYLYINKLHPSVNILITLTILIHLLIQLIDNDYDSMEISAYQLFISLFIYYTHSFLIYFLDIKNLTNVREYISKFLKELTIGDSKNDLIK